MRISQACPAMYKYTFTTIGIYDACDIPSQLPQYETICRFRFVDDVV